MKNILITGSSSYVGNALGDWLRNWPEAYNIDFISMKNASWSLVDLSIYDVVFHVAAIVHKKEKKYMEEQYFEVNRDLTLELANKSKLAGVKHFIFMSSFSVYGIEGDITKDIMVSANTQCSPNSYYGRSKYEAELGLQFLESEEFKISIIRAPMIYGPNSPGNYERLRKLILQIKIFPYINNQRSMIFIDNLSEFIKLTIDNGTNGVFSPQNKEYVNTYELVKLISEENDASTFYSKKLGELVLKVGKKKSIVNKMFGNLTYDLSISNYFDYKYALVDFPDSIKLCEKTSEKSAEN